MPALYIKLAVEGRPVIFLDCQTDSEERRLWDWISSRAELAELVDRAIELVEERAA